MLKVKFVLGIICYLSLCNPITGQAQNAETYTLQEAIKKRLIRYNAKGNNASLHYKKPLLLTVINMGNEYINIEVEAGLIFPSLPSKDQDIIVTKTTLFVLNPRAKKTVGVYSNCIQANNTAPSSATKYTYKENQSGSKDKLKKLARFINQKRYYGTSEAQHALWAISDNDDISDIYGFTQNGQVAKDLREYTAKLLGVPAPKNDDIDVDFQVWDNGEVVNTPYTPPIFRSEVSGELDFGIYQDYNIQVGMFDPNGVLVREIYNEPNCKKGLHKLKYTFELTEYTEEFYDFKLIRNAKVWTQMRVNNKR